MNGNCAPLITGLIGAGCLAAGMLTRKIIASVREREPRGISHHGCSEKAEAREAGGSLSDDLGSATEPTEDAG